MSVLITGGCGSIGSWVVRKLLEENANPVIYDLRSDTGLIRDIEGSIPVIQGNILDFERLIKVIKEHRVRKIIHLAAELGQDIRKNDPYLEIRVLVDGTAKLLEAARLMEIERFVYSSSRAVYGTLDGKYLHPQYEPIPEEAAIPGGSTPIYSAGKYLMEKAGLHYVSLGLDFVALRFGTVYGPGKIKTHGAKKTRAIHALIVENAIKGKITEGLKGGDGLADCVYFKDVADGIVKACFAERPLSRIYNISAGVGSSFKDWARVINKIFPKISLEVGAGDLTEFGLQGGILDISKARKEIGYEPKYLLERGISDFIAEVNRLALVG